jgi:hypothetical protein
MPERVVHHLEDVEVDEAGPRRGSVAARTARMNSSRSSSSAGWQSRELVVVGEEVDARLGLLAPADVAHDREAVELPVQGMTRPSNSPA